MTDKNDMIRMIEEKLGSEGSMEGARRMFDVLRASGKIDFSPDSGFEMEEMDEDEWLKYLVAAEV
jgi:hypothetical protein